MAAVFISYRRDDTAGYAGRIRDRLANEYGSGLLFMDVDSIDLGLDFVDAIKHEVAKCEALIAVIGPNWLTAADEKGNRRLDDPNDFVRLEIATALRRDIRVIPILLNGTKIPNLSELPDDLKGLATRNGFSVRHDSFHTDMYELIGRLKVLELVPLQIESRERKREGSKVQREHLPVNVRKANKVVWRLAPFGVFGALLPGISTLFYRSDAFAFSPEPRILIGQVIYLVSAAVLAAIFPYGPGASPFRATLVGICFPTIIGTAMGFARGAVPNLAARGAEANGLGSVVWVLDAFSLF